MQTTDTSSGATPTPRHPDQARVGGRLSRWRRDLRAIRAAMPRGAGLALGMAAIALLGAAAAGLPDYWRNLAQNTAADLIGAIVTMYLIIPMAQRPRIDALPPQEASDLPSKTVPVELANDQTSSQEVRLEHEV